MLFRSTNLASTLNYDVKKTDGEIKGVFTDQVGHAKVYVEEYDGEISTGDLMSVMEILPSVSCDSRNILVASARKVKPKVHTNGQRDWLPV